MTRKWQKNSKQNKIRLLLVNVDVTQISLLARVWMRFS